MISFQIRQNYTLTALTLGIESVNDCDALISSQKNNATVSEAIFYRASKGQWFYFVQMKYTCLIGIFFGML